MSKCTKNTLPKNVINSSELSLSEKHPGGYQCWQAKELQKIKRKPSGKKKEIDKEVVPKL